MLGAENTNWPQLEREEEVELEKAFALLEEFNRTGRRFTEAVRRAENRGKRTALKSVRSGIEKLTPPLRRQLNDLIKDNERLLGLEKAALDYCRPEAPRLKPNQLLALIIIHDHPNGIPEKALRHELRTRYGCEMSHSVLSTRVMPVLKKWYWVGWEAGIGFYIIRP